jgi:hypothetical protein
MAFALTIGIIANTADAPTITLKWHEKNIFSVQIQWWEFNIPTWLKKLFF